MIYKGGCHCGKKGNPMAAINIRCLADVDLASVPVKHFDGRSM
jgi:hypothetical protein